MFLTDGVGGRDEEGGEGPDIVITQLHHECHAHHVGAPVPYPGQEPGKLQFKYIYIHMTCTSLTKLYSFYGNYI